MNWEALIIALVPSLTIGFLTYRVSRRKDAASEQSGVASNHRAGIDQAMKGLNDLVDQLQEQIKALRQDNADDRKDFAALADKLADKLRAAIVERDAAIAERDLLRAEVALLKRQFGVT